MTQMSGLNIVHKTVYILPILYIKNYFWGGISFILIYKAITMKSLELYPGQFLNTRGKSSLFIIFKENCKVYEFNNKRSNFLCFI